MSHDGILICLTVICVLCYMVLTSGIIYGYVYLIFELSEMLRRLKRKDKSLP